MGPIAERGGAATMTSHGRSPPQIGVSWPDWTAQILLHGQRRDETVRFADPEYQIQSLRLKRKNNNVERPTINATELKKPPISLKPGYGTFWP